MALVGHLGNPGTPNHRVHREAEIGIFREPVVGSNPRVSDPSDSQVTSAMISFTL